MRITQEADYAIRICCLLSTSEGITDAASISDSVAVPPRFALKILRKLSQGGAVRSHKGATGGYELALDPQTLTVRQVVELIDGPIYISKCLSNDHACTNNPEKSCCRMHNLFSQLNDMLTERLDRVTVASVADSSIPLSELLEIIK